LTRYCGGRERAIPCRASYWPFALRYGPRITQLFHQRAQLVIKVLRGAEPADIPVEQPTTFELAINLQAARAIGYEVPAGIVLRADKVIE
jgi:putative tryptophan/tyrosine transport system substrate-binding protein